MNLKLVAVLVVVVAVVAVSLPLAYLFLKAPEKGPDEPSHTVKPRSCYGSIRISSEDHSNYSLTLPSPAMTNLLTCSARAMHRLSLPSWASWGYRLSVSYR